jgi:hypothetical protein
MPSDEGNTRARLEIVEAVADRMRHGESVRGIFRSPGENYPTEITFWRWIAADPELLKVYEEAAVKRAERYAEDINALQDEEPPRITTQFGTRVDPGWVQWQKNRIDTRKWTASKLLPKKYGDRTILSGDNDSPVAITIENARSALLDRVLAGATKAEDRGGDPDPQ